MLLSFVAHAGGYKIMVGAHNTVDVTVECQVHVGGCVCLLQEGLTSVPAKYCLPRGVRGVSPCLPGMVNPGAYNTIDAQRHVRGFLPCRSPTTPTIL